MIRYLITTLFLFSFISSYAADFVGTKLQNHVDEILTEFNRIKDKKPYINASDILLQASNAASRSFDKRPHIIIRTAHQKYMMDHNIVWLDKSTEYHEWKGLLQIYDFLKKPYRKYGVTYLNAWARLYFLKYRDSNVIPLELTKLQYTLENMPPFEIEPEFKQYYELLDGCISEKNRLKMLDFVKNEKKKYSADDWLYSGVLAILDSKSNKYIIPIIEYVQKIDQTTADALLGYYIEINGPSIKKLLKDNDSYAGRFMYKSLYQGKDTPDITNLRTKMLELYAKSASKGNVLGSIRYANFIYGKEPDKAMSILSCVEGHDQFAEYAGSLVKAQILAKSDIEEDVRETSRLTQECIDKCIDSFQVKSAKKLYNDCQTKISLFDMQHYEQLINIDDALPEDLIAIAKGYESIEGCEKKAMEYYRLAADLDDIESLCRVTLYDLYNGVSEENEQKTIDASNIILKNAESGFIPFLYNAIVVKLFGLNGMPPNPTEAEKLFNQLKTKLVNDKAKDLKDTGLIIASEDISYICRGGEDFDAAFNNYEKALRNYKDALQKETNHEYKDAEWFYNWARTWGHPLAEPKQTLMIKKQKQKKQQENNR